MATPARQAQARPAAVISCSRRTDIPRYYCGWLEERMAAGEVTFRAPRGTLRTVSLAPADVHSIVLISKDYGPLLRRPALLARLEGHNTYFHFTITGLGGSRWEPGAPAWRDAVAQAAVLAERFGPERVNWRFDPVVHWPGDAGVESNLPFFGQIADAVAAIGVSRCTFSFAQWYRKSQRRAAREGIEFIDPPDGEKLENAAGLAALAAEREISLASCSNRLWTGVDGIEVGHCIDGALLTALRKDGAGAPLAKDRGQRQQCGCTLSIDIGSYAQRCGSRHCVYCYAN